MIHYMHRVKQGARRQLIAKFYIDWCSASPICVKIPNVDTCKKSTCCGDAN